MLCNISQNAMGQPPGGEVPSQVQLGEVPWPGGYPGGGGTQVRYPSGGTLGDPMGGYQVRYPQGGTLAGGVPCQVQPWGSTLPGPAGGGGSTWLGGGTLPGPAGVGEYPGQDNIGSTCYTAGDMPLAFTQEDFLVHYCVNQGGGSFLHAREEGNFFTY